MDMNKYVGGEFLDKESLKISKAWVVTNVKAVKFDGNEKEKLQLELEYKTIKKSFTLNATNIKILITLFDSETDNLIGKIVVFVPSKVTFKNEIKDSILVDEEETRQRNGLFTRR